MSIDDHLARASSRHAAERRRPSDRAAGLRTDRPQAHAQATAAAEPLDEPPGVRSRFQGLRVGGGSIQAKWVVTVLPMITAPASRRLATTSASYSATLSAQGFEPAGGRQSRDVDDVLDADRDPVERAPVLAAGELLIEHAGLPIARRDRARPSLDPRLPLVDPVEAPLQDLDARRLAFAQGSADACDRLVLREESRNIGRADST